MRYCITIFLVFFSTALTIAQTNKKAIQFINELIDTKNANEELFISKMFAEKNIPYKAIVRNNLFYQDSVDAGAIANIRNDLKRYGNVFRGIRQDSVIYVDSVGKRTILSRADANNIAMKKIGPDGIIRSRIEQIAADSLVITEKERAYINTEIEKMQDYSWGKNQFLNVRSITADTIKKAFAKFGGWDALRKKGISRIYNFSNPIFLRSDTFCFFYYGYGCGSLCGEGQFAIYKKQKGKWVMFTMLSRWVS
jgi:hypothetical protein